jgi:plasmid stabilization system protein ParE
MAEPAPYKVSLSPTAEALYQAADAWWRLNRRAAPNLLSYELERALLNLADQPLLGRAARSALFGSVRVYLLRRTSYKVYYQILEDIREVYVVYFRHGRRRPLSERRRRRRSTGKR